mmetsp:Transcript_28747/g.27712  ORF Transcript_28747/g.27712 Transcript_28747/m.27712 type:complete len:95 (+) Transcript_28747:266-550(+)
MAYLLLILVLFKWNYTPNATFIVKVLLTLACLKFFSGVLNIRFWQLCPWQDERLMGYINSIKVTLGAVYQSVFCVLILLLAMGFKICRNLLTRK